MSNDCGMRVHLSAYADGELAGALRAGIEAHLQDCPGCTAALRELEALRGAFRALPPLAAGVDLAPVLWPRLERERAAGLWPRAGAYRGWRLAPLSLAAAATVVIGVFLGTLLVHGPAPVGGAPGAAMALFDPVPPGGICLASRLCPPAGKI